jgi:hypothetical protein
LGLPRVTNCYCRLVDTGYKHSVEPIESAVKFDGSDWPLAS